MASKSTTNFESKLFPHFILFNTELAVSKPSSSFLAAFSYQISIIEGLLENDIFTSNSITNSSGVDIPVSKNDYRNVSDRVLNAIKSHGIEHGLAYQVFRMIYRFETYEVGGFRDENNVVTGDTEVYTRTSFVPEKFNKSYLNPLARFYYKYAVSLEKETVKTAIFSKDKEVSSQYKIDIKVPTPYIVSEIFVSFKENNVIIFNIPNVFTPNSEEYLTLPVQIEDNKAFESLKTGFYDAQNIYLSMITLDNNNNLILRFDGLNIINEFFINRRAAEKQSKSEDGSSDFYKVKLSEMQISTEHKDEYSNISSKLIRRRRERIEFNLKHNIDETDYLTRVNKSKQVMHGIRNTRGDN